MCAGISNDLLIRWEILPAHLDPKSTVRKPRTRIEYKAPSPKLLLYFLFRKHRMIPMRKKAKRSYLFQITPAERSEKRRGNVAVRWKKTSAEERSEHARAMAVARWSNQSRNQEAA